MQFPKIIFEGFFRVFIQFPLVLLGLLKHFRDIKEMMMEEEQENEVV